MKSFKPTLITILFSILTLALGAHIHIRDEEEVRQRCEVDIPAALEDALERYITFGGDPDATVEDDDFLVWAQQNSAAYTAALMSCDAARMRHQVELRESQLAAESATSSAEGTTGASTSTSTASVRSTAVQEESTGVSTTESSESSSQTTTDNAAAKLVMGARGVMMVVVGSAMWLLCGI